MFASSREGILQEASVEAAWNLQVEFYRKEVFRAMTAADMGEYVAGVRALEDMLETHNMCRLVDIEISAGGAELFRLAEESEAQGMSGEEAYAMFAEALM